MAPRIETHRTLDAFFEGLLEKALTSVRMEMDPGCRAYVVQLCAEAAMKDTLHAGQRAEDPGTPALFKLYEQAVQSAPREQFNAYRHLGDVALLVSGFYTPHIERTLVGVDYYVQMGGAAYGRAAVLSKGGLGEILDKLASQFRRLVEVLTRMAEQTTLPIARDMRSLYDRWIRDPQQEDLYARLGSMGAMPVRSRARG